MAILNVIWCRWLLTKQLKHVRIYRVYAKFNRPRWWWFICKSKTNSSAIKIVFCSFKNLNMQINLKKIRLLLRIIGTISLILFFIFQIGGSDNLLKNQFLFLSALCFFVILISSLIVFLKKYYYKE